MGKRGVGDYTVFWDTFIPRMFDLLQKRGWEWGFVDFCAHVPHCSFDEPYYYGFDEKRDDFFYEQWMEGDTELVIKKKWVFHNPRYKGRRMILWGNIGLFGCPDVLKKVVISLDVHDDVCVLNSRQNILHACGVSDTSVTVQYISQLGTMSQRMNIGKGGPSVPFIDSREVIKLVNIYFARSTPSPG